MIEFRPATIALDEGETVGHRILEYELSRQMVAGGKQRQQQHASDYAPAVPQASAARAGAGGRNEGPERAQEEQQRTMAGFCTVSVVRAHDGSVGMRFARPSTVASGPFEDTPCAGQRGRAEWCVACWQSVLRRQRARRVCADRGECEEPFCWRPLDTLYHGPLPASKGHMHNLQHACLCPPKARNF